MPVLLWLLLPCTGLAQQTCQQQVNILLQMAEKGDAERKLQNEATEMKMEAMMAKMLAMEEEIVELKKQAKANAESRTARDFPEIPYVMVCSVRNSWHGMGTVTYDRVSTEFNNCDRPGGGCGDMDITTGTFTAMRAGTYAVSYSAYVSVYENNEIQLTLQHNDQSQEEGKWWNACGVGCGHIHDQASASLVRTVMVMVMLF